jgi:hypothetical protein
MQHATSGAHADAAHTRPLASRPAPHTSPADAPPGILQLLMRPCDSISLCARIRAPQAHDCPVRPGRARGPTSLTELILMWGREKNT